MKTKTEVEEKIIELARKLQTANGSKAYGIRQQIFILNWVLLGEKTKKKELVKIE